MEPVLRSTTVTSTSAWSVVPATGGVSMLTSSKYPRRRMRTFERSIRGPSYQADSSCRISRRITSSFVRALPLMLIRRM